MLTKLLRAAGAMVLAATLVSCSDGNMLAPTPGELRLTTASTGGVVISQVYGGGGNSGSVYKNDFIELFNSSASPVSLAGWSVQYASTTGTSWQVTALSGTIAPGGYFLVQEAAGTGGTTALPAANVVGTIPMGATGSKVALVSSITALTGSCPLGPSVIDFIGSGAANCFEGSGAAPAPSNANSNLRKADGCTDTDVNSADFVAVAAAPRNSASATRTCQAVPARPVVTVTIAPTDAAITVGTQQELVATGKDDSGNPVAGTTFTWTTSNAAVATVSSAGIVTAVAPGTATITATTPNNVSGSATITVSAASGSASNVRISEFHYDNDGVDTGEAVEIEGDAGGSLAGWSLVLYSGSTGSATQGQSYSTIVLSGTLPSTCGTHGVLSFPAAGLQNGDKDGFALVNAGGTVVEFLSYEGSFTATNGPAAGMTSTDVGVAETGTSAAGRSLQRAGNGTWYGPSASTFGACNPATPPLPQTGITFTGRHPTTDPALPIGMQDQLFATLRDAGTGATIPTVFAWTSETPLIATVDQDGVITAVSAGTATFRATATDGTTATYSLPMHVATASQTAQYGHNTEFGEPTDADASDDYLIRYAQFTSSFNKNRNTPNWVSYNIDATHFGAEDRCDCFTYDGILPADFPRYTTAAYTGAGTFHGYGIDRGHLARSFDRTAGSFDNAHTYYFSNIIPQAADNNQGPWALMENYLGDLARRDNKEVFVIAGVAGSKGTLKNEGRIVIPAQVWKVAVVMNRDQGLANVDSYDDVEVIAAILPNDAGIRNVQWETYKTTVDAVEAISGYDILAALPDRIERVVESGTRAPVAHVDGPYLGAEGSAISLSANGSTDPDGDALTYAWEFGDGTTGTGANPSHVYADNGAYIARVTVSDPSGAEDVASTSVTVVNVAPSLGAIADGLVARNVAYTAAGTIVDPGSDSWTVTADYGDGSGVQAVAVSGRGFTLSHSYATLGTYTVTVTVRDDDGDSDTKTAQVVVQNGAPSASAGSGYAGSEGSVISFNAAGSSDPDGDALTYSWSFGDGTTGTGANPTHVYADNGSYTATVTVTDAFGATDQATATVTVGNVAPSVHVFAGGTIFQGETFSGSTSFDDPGADQWTATVDYGDGTGTHALAISGRNLALSHSYSAAGTFTVTVTVRDNDGGVGTQTATVTVQSPAEGLQGLQAAVSTLERAGSLTSGNAQALLAKLRAADASLARGDETPAVNQLQAFVNQVNALVRSDRLTQAQADAMTAAARRIIRSIQM